MIGALVGHKLNPEFKENINMIFGVCSMGMGISTIVLMENMPAVIFALIIGTSVGLAVHLGEKINTAAGGMQIIVSGLIQNNHTETSEEFMAALVTVIVLFCASGTGIYGSIIMFATGFRMIKLKMFPVADMIPAMILVMPFSWIWVNDMLPFVS